MFNPKKPVPKPLPCNQVWEDMLPVDGGRVCKGCGKVVVDFRKFNWYEIEQTQLDSIVPLCGIYNPKQIEEWGAQLSEPLPSEPKKAMEFLAAILAFLQFSPLGVSAQTKAPQHQMPSVRQPQNQIQKHENNDPPEKRVISGTVITQLFDSTKRPLAGVNLAVIKGSDVVVATSDSFGRYFLDLSILYKYLPDTFEIGISHPKYLTQTIKLYRDSLKANEANALNITLSEISITDKARVTYTTSSTAFYTQTIEPGKKVKYRKIKAWWHRLWKKKS